ncbi:MAG: hypothetical protein WCG01_02705 [bacterium]
MENKILKIFLLLFFFLILPNFTQAALSVPLTIQETLPAGVTGLDRASENFSSGIPLAQDSGITNVNQLGLTNSTAAQFRALAWWPNGNIKWVLVDGQSSISAGGTDTTKALTDGTGNFGGSDLATDNGANISINTGNAQFVIRKSGFNIFDNVVVDGQELVISGNAGRISAVGLDGLTYTSINDAHTQVAIEENGPVRSVIKVMGALENSSNARLMDYTLRIHFYKDSSKVKSFVTLRNASAVAKTDVAFNNLEVVVPLSLSGQKTVLFSRKTDTISRTLGTGESAYMYQGYNTTVPVINNLDCYYWHIPIPGTCNGSTLTPDINYLGMAIKVGNEWVNSVGTTTDSTQGFADMSIGGRGISVARKWMSAYWPAGFEFNDNGETSIEIYSKNNGAEKVGLGFGRHFSSEIMWDFHVTSSDGKSALYALQYPLLARANLDYYGATKSIFGQDEFVSEAQQNTFFTNLHVGHAAPTYLINPSMQVIRSWQWDNTGGANQTDTPLQWLTDYLRTGRGGFFQLGSQRTVWTMENAIGIADDYVGFYHLDASILHPFDNTSNYPAFPGGTMSRIKTGFADTEHANFSSIPFYYFLTGDENIKEGYLKAGERWKKANDMGYYAVPNINTPLRPIGKQFRNMALAYEFSCQIGACNNSWKTTIENALTTFLDMRDNPSQGWGTDGTPVGRNMERGYVWWDKAVGSQGQTSTPSTRLIHEFYQTQILTECMYQVWRVMRDTDWNYSKMLYFQDFLTGLSQFIFNEFAQPVTDSGPPAAFYGYPVDYQWAFYKEYAIDQLQSTINPLNAADKIRMSVHDVSRAARWGYEHTGDSSILDKGNSFLWGIQSETGCTAYPSELQDQTLMYAYFNKATIPTWQTIVPNVVDNGGGSYTLNWTVPAGAKEYQIKYADKPIVEWLGFDKNTRAYQYDPANYTAFFAANNITNNPVPVTAGTVQSITLTGLPSNQNFSMKFLSDIPDIIAPNAPNGLSVI